MQEGVRRATANALLSKFQYARTWHQPQRRSGSWIDPEKLTTPYFNGNGAPLTKVEQEAALDGIYVLRTPLRAELIEAPDIVRSYKSLSNVERAFRSLKTVDLKVRPIHHHLPDRVRAHILLCMLAYYVEWHMREAWRALLFADEDQAAKATRDPVAPAMRSQQAEHKACTHTCSDGTPVHSFRTLLDELSTIVRNTCRASTDSAQGPTFTIVTQPNAVQQRALKLLETIAV